jgi:hypothetical protein
MLDSIKCLRLLILLDANGNFSPTLYRVGIFLFLFLDSIMIFSITTLLFFGISCHADPLLDSSRSLSLSYISSLSLCLSVSLSLCLSVSLSLCLSVSLSLCLSVSLSLISFYHPYSSTLVSFLLSTLPSLLLSPLLLPIVLITQKKHQK